MSALTFYSKIPEQITINRNWVCRPSEPETLWKEPYLVETASTVERVKAALDLSKGPFAARVRLGPSNYTTEPIQFNDQTPEPVYGWQKGAKRTSKTVQQPIIVCGCQGQGTEGRIYYVLAEDVSKDPKMAIGAYRPSSTDKRVFVSSVARFAEFELDKFPPVSEEEKSRYSAEKVVPPPFVGKPDLIAMWEQGTLIYKEFEDGRYQVLQVQPRPQVYVAAANNLSFPK